MLAEFDDFGDYHALDFRGRGKILDRECYSGIFFNLYVFILLTSTIVPGINYL